MEQQIQPIDFAAIIPKFDKILSRGLCKGLGDKNGRMCIEAAICTALDLPFSDDPICVTREIRDFKVHLNDCAWSSPEARAKGLRDLGIAQIGSKGVVDGKEFKRKLIERYIKIIVPALFREMFSEHQLCLNAALNCELYGTIESLDAAANSVDIRYAFSSDIFGQKVYAKKLNCSFIRFADNIPFYANSCSKFPDEYLLMAAQIGLDVLKELKSPGCDWI